jgi:hypothetical protein
MTKFGLGYNKKEDNDKWSTNYKHEKGSSFSKRKGEITKKLQVMNFVKEGSYISKKEEENQMTYFSRKNAIKKETPSMDIYFLLIASSIKQWTARN